MHSICRPYTSRPALEGWKLLKPHYDRSLDSVRNTKYLGYIPRVDQEIYY